MGQLGPIGAAVDAQLASTDDEARRCLLLATREAAVTMYRSLQDLIQQETGVRPAVVTNITAVRGGGGMGVPRLVRGMC